MVEKEFLKMIDTQLDAIIQESELLTKQLLYYQSVDRGSKQIGYINFQLAILRKKQQVLKSLTGFPAYARIKAMSDEELAQYKTTQKDMLNSEVQETLEQIGQVRERIAALNKEQYEQSLSFSGLSEEQRTEAITRGRQIISELESEDKKLQKLLGSIYDQKDQLKKVNQKQPGEIRNDMLSKAERKKTIEDSVNRVLNNPVSDTEKMLASVADDPIKCQQMIYLLTLYGRLLSAEKNIKTHLELPEALPDELHALIVNHSSYDDKGKYAYDVGAIEKIFQDFSGRFAKDKGEFNYQFTEGKLIGLAGKEKDRFYDSMDVGYLVHHRDKLELGKVDQIYDLIDRHNRLDYRVIKTKAIKDRIQNLNTLIQLEINEVYHRIIAWYYANVPKSLGLHSKLDFFSEQTLCDFIENSQVDIDLSEQAMHDLNNRLMNAQNDLNAQKEGFTNQKTEVAGRIRSIAGAEFAKTDMPSVKDEVSYNENLLLEAIGRVYAEEIIRNVTRRAGQKAIQAQEALRQGHEQENNDSLNRKI